MSKLQRVFRRAVGASLLAGLVSASSAACSDRFAACKELRNCAPPVGEGGAAGEATSGGADVGGAPESSAGGPESSAGRSDTEVGGAAGTASIDGAAGAVQGELAPPAGAFAWYKATQDDVVVGKATLADGNDFIKSAWVKTDLTAKAMQPDAEGGNTATALYSADSALVGRSMKHAVLATQGARKTLRIRARMGEYRYLWIAGARFDLREGVANGGVGVATNITPLKDLWYLCEATVVAEAEFSVAVSASNTGPAAGGPNSTDHSSGFKGLR